MTIREACVLSAYTGTLLCDINTLRQFLSDEKAPDPFMAFSTDMAKELFDELKERYKEEFHEIISSLTAD